MANKMMNDTLKRENISALVDGELNNGELELVLKQLLFDKEDDVWNTYHLIGDVVRSDDLAAPLSSGFTQRFAEKFAAEPLLLMPEKHVKVFPEKSSAQRVRQYLRTYLTVASVAAAAVFAFMFGPLVSQFGQDKYVSTQLSKAPVMQSEVQLVSASNATDNTLLATAEDSSTDEKVQMNTPAKEAAIEMMRDPRIDSYLIAHQRFSPAISNAAQYVTQANTATTASGK